eukprot:TRINITY_DN3509_c0_g1_i1.p1 TRINITY_DN3509_c0_g1~~TRINITY_DN3509_c0_g1_i1.p1  ORF type:complete len:245 (-),score=14.81 TRINITY_DN3509_c0_g1_i1:300-1034(-)
MFVTTLVFITLLSGVGSQVVPVTDPVANDCKSVTLEGCTCRDEWTVSGTDYTQCSDPTNFGGPWCGVEPDCYNDGEIPGKWQEGFFSRRSYGFCPPGGCVAPSCLTTLESLSSITTFIKIAKATNVIGMISDSTVLIPTNTVLDAVVSDLGLDLDNLNEKQLQTLLGVLRKHVIPGFLLTRSDAESLNQNLATLSEGTSLSVGTGSVLTFSVVGGSSSTAVVQEVQFTDPLCNVAAFIVNSVLM